MKKLLLILLLIATTPVFAQYKITDYTRDTNMTDDDIVSGANSPDGATPTNAAYTLGALKTYINAGVSTVTNWSDLQGLKAAVNWADESRYLSTNALNWQGLQQVQSNDVNWSSLYSSQLQKEAINWSSINAVVDGTNIGIGTSVLDSLLKIDQNNTTNTTRKSLSLTTNGSTLLDNSSYAGTDETWDNLWEAIKFTPTQTGTGLYGQMCVSLKIGGTQTTFDKQFGIRIYTDSAGSPGTSVSGSAEAFPKWGSMTTSYTEFCQALGSGVTLTSGTSYWAVLRKYTEPSQTVYINSTTTGTNTHAYSADGTTWTTESSKDGYVKLYSATPSTASFTNNQGGGIPITATSYTGQAAISASTTYGANVYTGVLGNNGQTYLGTAHYGTGANMISNYGWGYRSQTISGVGANFVQTGSLTFDSYAPNLYVSRTNTLGAFAHRGPLVRIEDTTASTGDLLRVVKQNVPKAFINSSGNTILGGNLTVADTSSLGSEKVANGTFTGSAASWTVGAGWAYNSNNIYHSTGSTADLSQTVSAVVGETYLVSLVISNNTNVNASLTGKLTVTLGGTSAVPWADNSGGQTYFPSTVNYIITAATTGDLILTPDTNFNGIVDTVSVKKITSGNILTAGNIGIGSSVPGAKLTIIGSGTTSATRNLQIRDSSFADLLAVTDAGNIGVGSSNPGQKIDLGTTGTMRAIGIGTTVPQQLCRKATGDFGYFDGAWAGTCN